MRRPIKSHIAWKENCLSDVNFIESAVPSYTRRVSYHDYVIVHAGNNFAEFPVMFTFWQEYFAVPDGKLIASLA